MFYKLTKANDVLKGSIHLPISKSESNRLLILWGLLNQPFELPIISDSDDTTNLFSILKKSFSEKSSNIPTYNVGLGGTTMRFLTAYFAVTPGERILTGEDRIKERPIKILVDSLQGLGANISYLEKEGYAPIKIIGTKLIGGTIEVDASVSSQYISALLLIAPFLEEGLNVNLKGKIISSPYIHNTLHILSTFGFNYSATKNSISIPPKRIEKWNKTYSAYKPEADWTAASYWYSFAACCKDVHLELKGLRKDSYQGDVVLKDLYTVFGIKTEFTTDGIVITKGKCSITHFDFNCNQNPDLAQSIILSMVGLKIKGTISGLETLKIKETDRVSALVKELKKLGVSVEESPENCITISAFPKEYPSSIRIETYNDHRMAMALSLLGLLCKEGIYINNPEVVTKSYKKFWEDLKETNLFSLSGHKL